MLSFSLIGYKLTFLGEFGLFPLKIAYWANIPGGGGAGIGQNIYIHVIQNSTLIKLKIEFKGEDECKIKKCFRIMARLKF